MKFRSLDCCVIIDISSDCPILTCLYYSMSVITQLQMNHLSFLWAASWENRSFNYVKTKTQISFTVTAKLISAFVFATRIVQFLFLFNPKFQASSRFLWLYRSVCVRPGRKSRRLVFTRHGSVIITVTNLFKPTAETETIIRVVLIQPPHEKTSGVGLEQLRVVQAELYKHRRWLEAL